MKVSRAVYHQWHDGFLKMVPAIVRSLRIAFAHLKAEAREESVAEALANTCVAYQRLHQQGRSDRACAVCGGSSDRWQAGR